MYFYTIMNKTVKLRRYNVIEWTLESNAFINLIIKL